MNKYILMLLGLCILGACSTHTPVVRTPAATKLPQATFTCEDNGSAVQYAIACHNESCSKVIVIEEDSGYGNWPTLKSKPMFPDELEAIILKGQPPRDPYTKEMKDMGGPLESSSASNFEKVTKPVVWAIGSAVSAVGNGYEKSSFGTKAIEKVKKNLVEANQNLRVRKMNGGMNLSRSDFRRAQSILKPLLPKE